MKLKLLLLEDDHIQRDELVKILEERVDAKVFTKSTEWEFKRDFEMIAADCPDIAVLDVMVRWAKPSRDMPAAEQDVTDNPHKAGLRCAKMIRNDPRTANVKIILYSVLGREDMNGQVVPEGVVCLVKEADWENLLDEVKRSSPQTVA